MRQFLGALLAIGFFVGALAESHGPAEPKQQDEHRLNGEANGLGAFGTVYWTWGFGYRRHFNNGLGLSVNIGPWFDGSYGHLGLGIGLLYTFVHYKFNKSALPDSSIRVYGVGFLSPRYERSVYYESGEDRKKTALHAFYFGFGAGPGVEYFFNRHFAIHFEMPWMTFFKVTGGKTSFANSYPHYGGGLVYYF